MDRKPRARRALPLIGAALTLVIAVSVLYLRTGTPSIDAGPVRPAPTPIPHLSGSYRTTFDFVDPSHGWALILEYIRPGRLWIFATADGARHWRRQFGTTAYVGADHGPPTNIYIHFFDARSGFAYAGDLYRTVDGGAHWDLVKTPTGGQLFAFASATRAWILPEDWSVPPHLYTTDDGGITWSAIPTPLPPGLNPQPFAGFGFRDDGEGWLGAALDRPAVYLTLDGGASWKSVTIPIGAQPHIDVYYTSVRVLPGHGVLALVISPQGFGAGYYSDDAGQSWRQVAPVLPAPDWLADASFVDATHWWVARFGFLYKTSTAGRDWARVLVRDMPGGWSIEAVHVIDADHAWWSMISTSDSRDSALMMTSDGGAYWRAVNMPQPS
jgi:photosystem II stability/assembly factor-like uncharacterized protein